MEITWWGTAAFRVKTGDTIFLIDPYFSRGPDAEPAQYLTPGHITEGKHIFITHGHFDHVYDTPDIARQNRATVYCAADTAAVFAGHRLSKRFIKSVSKNDETFLFDAFEARAMWSSHIKPDLRLIARTLLKVNRRLFEFLPFLNTYPAGQVLSWLFKLENKSLLFFGSAGSTAEEMERVSSIKTDVLFVPLQGHSNIHEIALEYVQVCRPSVVIPHHFDNFFPPISQKIDLKPFVDGVRRECPGTEVKILALNETIIL